MQRSFGRAFILSAVLCSLAGASATAQVTRNQKSQRAKISSLVSTRTSYGPDSQAILRGTGFYPNEVVVLRAAHEGVGGSHSPWSVVADARGSFTTAWLVCQDGLGATVHVIADGTASGAHGQVSFSNNHDCGTGVVTAVTPVGGSCSAFTPAVGNGPDNYEVQEGGTYVMTIEGVTECTGDTITVFVQSSSVGNFCFNATGGSGTYSGMFTMPDPACHTMPVSYKCGADASCNHPGSLGAQGPTSGCGGVHLRTATFDGSCNHTGADDDCGTTTPVGACCLLDGTCIEVSEDDCLAAGGTYGGDDSLCVNADCPQPAGACCLADGSCVQATEDDCATMGGSYYGDMSSCMDVSCAQPPGACCLVDGSCVQVTEEECADLGGTFNGDNSLCIDATCPQPAGACCLADGSCVQVTEEDCAALGGSFYGDFSLCMEVSCPQPTGSCCLADGSCVELTEEDCTAVGGLFGGDGTLCSETDCMGGNPVCFVLDFETDDDGNPMAHGAKVDAEFDCGGSAYPIAITGSANPSGNNTAAILNSTTGPATQDPDLLVARGNVLILQHDGNQSECPPASGVYCSHNDDDDGGTLSFAFCVPVTPDSLTLIDIDGSDGTSYVTLIDAGALTRTYTVPGNWTGDRIADFPEPGWKVLDLTTLANQAGFASVATASEDAGFDPSAVVGIVVTLGGSGAVDDLSWCQ